MTAYLVLIELRRRRWSLVLLGLLIAAVVGVVLASLAGARRAETAFDRYIEELRSPAGAAFGDPSAIALLDDLDAVEETIDFQLVGAFPEADTESFFPLIVSERGVLPYERMRAPVVDGRQADRDEPFEVALSERTARRLGVGVGDKLPLLTFSPEALEASEDELGEPDGPPITLDVVGIVRDPGDIGARESDITLTFLTPAFREAVTPDEVGSVGDGTMIAVAEGHDLSEVSAALEGQPIEIDTSFSTESSQQQANPTMRAIATSTRLFALVAALAGLIAVGQAIARLQVAAGADDRTLDSLGTGRRARWQRLFAPIMVATVGGTAAGVVLAVALSVLFPVGLARRAEPDLGLDVDGSVLLLGFLGSLLALTALVAVLATWRVRQRHEADGPVPLSRWSRTLADIGAPPAVVTGLSLAAGTPGRPGRIALVGTLLSVLGVLATLVFSASVDRLAGDPALYGWGWDAVIEGADLTDIGQEGVDAIGPALDEDPDVQAAAALYSQVPVTVDDVPLYATVVDEQDAALRPVMVRGTSPASADEVAIAGSSLDTIGADVGDEVTMGLGGTDRTVLVTGVVALPVPEDGGSSSTGVYLNPSITDDVDLEVACEESDSCTRTIAVALREGADLDAFAARYQDDELNVDVALPIPPGEVDRLTAVENLPRYLAAFLAALAAAAISFATSTTIRQRRRDLAVLRVLGMTGRHVRIVVVVLVLALTAAGAILGGVLGVIVGRQVWRAVSDSVSLPFAPSVPALAAVLVPIGAVLLAQAVASTSRRTAARVPAALVLRAE